MGLRYLDYSTFKFGNYPEVPDNLDFEASLRLAAKCVHAYTLNLKTVASRYIEAKKNYPNAGAQLNPIFFQEYVECKNEYYANSSLVRSALSEFVNVSKNSGNSPIELRFKAYEFSEFCLQDRLSKLICCELNGTEISFSSVTTS